ncbi:CAP domain-containing protein [Marinobacter hydrocarbonoclasticus]|nr:CAP domain-containing protein [Marinobacter nauticus]
MRSLLLLCLLWVPLAVAGSLTLSPVESEVLDELNFARTEPRRYAEEVLAPMLRYYQDGDIIEPPWRAPRPGLIQVVETQEGIDALKEAIEAMKSAAPAPALSASYGLTKAARDYREEQARQARVGHIGRNGSTPADRISRYGRWQELAGENLFYGDADRMIGRFVVMALIIDDGVPDRGHRLTIMEPRYRRVGIGFGAHPLYGYLCVQNFAAEFYDTP